MPLFPEFTLPLILRRIYTEDQLLTFWHDTAFFIFPPGSRLTITYKPRRGYYYLCFLVTFGKPRSLETGEVITTDDYGFYHRHSQMRWHWDPAVESIYEIEYPHFFLITRHDPMELEFYNYVDMDGDGVPDTTVIQDFSIWLWEISETRWPAVERYFRGIFNFFYALGGTYPLETARTLEKVLERLKGGAEV